jgi:hypothetical protein
MQMRPQLQIQTIIKAMTEDVIPALDQTNQLAMQSAQLTLGTLALIAQHLPLEYRYDCDELGRLIDAARQLMSHVGSDTSEATPAANLEAAATLGSNVLGRARAEPLEIVDAIRQLRSASSQAVKSIYADGNQSAQSSAEAIVLSMSKEQLLRDRSWLLIQGWEPNPKSVHPITDLLRPVADR